MTPGPSCNVGSSKHMSLQPSEQGGSSAAPPANHQQRLGGALSAVSHLWPHRDLNRKFRSLLVSGMSCSLSTVFTTQRHQFLCAFFTQQILTGECSPKQLRKASPLASGRLLLTWPPSSGPRWASPCHTVPPSLYHLQPTIWSRTSETRLSPFSESLSPLWVLLSPLPVDEMV